MSLVTSFLVMLQPLAWAMTAPTFSNLTTIMAGWAFAPRRTVTGMLLAAGAVGTKHHSAFHRLFAQAQWSLDRLGLIVFDLIEPYLAGEQIFLAIDDTLAQARLESLWRRHASRSALVDAQDGLDELGA